MTDTTDETEASTDIATLVEHNPAVVLLDGDKRQALFAHIESELVAFVPDLSTAGGREEVRRFAAKITKTKTAADKAGLDLTADARAKIAEVNAARNEIKERLSTLAERARRPLTEWEEAEEKRLAACEEALKELTAASIVPIDATSESVKRALAWAEGYHLDPALFGVMFEAATKARNHTIELLRSALDRIEQQERERAELEALRAEAERRRLADMEKAEREKAEAEARERAEQEAARREREAQEAREAAERAKTEAAERERIAAEQAKEREEQAAKAAQERATREARIAAEQERLAAEKAHQDALRAERARAEAAERAQREAEEERHRVEAARQAAADAERRRREKAEADANHRKRCKAEVKAVLLTTGITEDEAKAIVLLIVSGEVPRVTLDWAAEPKVQMPHEDVLKALL